MKYRYFAAALAVISSSAQAENWRNADYTEVWPALIAYVDTDSVSRSGNEVGFSALMYQEGSTPSLDESWSQRWVANCASIVYVVQSSTHYVGTTLESQSGISSYTPAAGLTAENMVKSACGQRNYLTDTIADPNADANDFFMYLDEDW